MRSPVENDRGYRPQSGCIPNEIVHRLNKTPQVRREFHHPMEAMEHWVDACAAEQGAS